jgi:hypothetical protein
MMPGEMLQLVHDISDAAVDNYRRGVLKLDQVS